jgi:glycosyltransferase involved in cell wall biosynthesis
MRFHVLALPHTQTTRGHAACAYTTKVRVFCQMMTNLGHTVIHYGAEGSDPICSEHVDVISTFAQNKWFGDKDWSKQMYDVNYDPKEPYWQLMNANCIQQIKLRIEPKDFICVIAGGCQKEVAEAFPNHMTVEFGVGYKGGFSKYKVYESYAWMHYIYGQNRLQNGNHYDAVIPNYYDPVDFPLGEGKGDYLMFIGRMIANKGPHIAADIAKECGMPLVMAGQGIHDQRIENDEMVYTGHGVKIKGNHINFVGRVNAADRAALMGNAKAVIVQTQYVGPFEGVHVESMMCGTPVITTDYGCFAETVIDGFNGYRTRTFGEAVWAAKQAKEFDLIRRSKIRDHAHAKWSIDVVAKQYEVYFKQLMGLWDKGWTDKEYAPTDRLRA